MKAFSYEENRIKLHDVGHMTKMAAMPIYVMNLSKYSPDHWTDLHETLYVASPSSVYK